MLRLRSLSIYETPSHFYVVGADSTYTRYSTLKIDRTAERDFVVGEPDHDYSKADILELLATVSSSSIVTSSEQSKRTRGHVGGLLRTVENAYGIIGAIRFFQGYYLLVVTRAKAVLRLGHHDVYKVEDVSMIYLPATVAVTHPEEQKYVKLFQSVDLTTNFYFSYTYDVSRTLQENALAQKRLQRRRCDGHVHFPQASATGGHAEEKFVWNDYLLKPLRDNLVSAKWTLQIVHGYVGYNIVDIPCAKFLIALIARRSAVFAGTRFLKRGTNFHGAVANDVETEQILWDVSSTPDICTGKFAAFAQRRGSVPLFWSQEPAGRGVVGKPPIYVDLVEPNALTTAAHFRELSKKYGHPIIVMNLVKRQEKRHNENILHEQFLKTVKYLNQFRERGRGVDYIGFDVSHCHSRSGQVLEKLEQLGTRAMLLHGWFQSFRQLKSRENHGHWLMDAYRPHYSADGTMILQRGISRANCVDCLDRTNVAQFGIGKVALGLQLYAMGYIDEPLVTLNAEVCRVLEDLYDEHGDTLAWQYAGSQLVHSIKTYKRTAVFQERSRDVFQTISRYYSNTFSDYEKQDGINLFLGIYRPLVHGHISAERYLHFPAAFVRHNEILCWAINVSSDDEQYSIEGEEEIKREGKEEDETDENAPREKQRMLGKRTPLLALDYRDGRKLVGNKQVDEKHEIEKVQDETQAESGGSVLEARKKTSDNARSTNESSDKRGAMEISSSNASAQAVNNCESSDKLAEKSTNDASDVYDPHERLVEMSMDDWIFIKAEEAGLFFSNEQDECLQDGRRDSSTVPGVNDRPDMFALMHRTFELTSLDQLLRDSLLTRRAITVTALTQNSFQSMSAFMKLFKATDPLQRRPSSANSYTNPTTVRDEEEDDGFCAEASYNNDSSYITIDEDKNLFQPPPYQQFQQIQHYRQLQQLYQHQHQQQQHQQLSISTHSSSASFYYNAQQHHGAATPPLPRSPQSQHQQFFAALSRRSSMSPDSAQRQMQRKETRKDARMSTSALQKNKSNSLETIAGYRIIQPQPKRAVTKLTLHSGLKSTKSVYGFEYKKSSEADLKKYERYASMCASPTQRANPTDEATNRTAEEKRRLFIEQYKLTPMFEFKPSFLTVDDAFHTELNEVSAVSLAVYRSRVLELAAKAVSDAVPLKISADAQRQYAKISAVL